MSNHVFEYVWHISITHPNMFPIRFSHIQKTNKSDWDVPPLQVPYLEVFGWTPFSHLSASRWGFSVSNGVISHVHTDLNKTDPTSRWWFQPIWKILVKLDHFLRNPSLSKPCDEIHPNVFHPVARPSPTIAEVTAPVSVSCFAYLRWWWQPCTWHRFSSKIMF